jgi:hypothetical protein
MKGSSHPLNRGKANAWPPTPWKAPRKEKNRTTSTLSGSRISGTQEDPKRAADSNQITESDEGQDTAAGALQNDPSYRPEYVGRVISYTDPHTNRPEHGLVGNYITKQGYNVLFKYIDDCEPQESEQEWPLQWIEDLLVDEATARAWTNAVTDQDKQNSPTSGKPRQTNVTTVSAKRVRGTLSSVHFPYGFLIFEMNSS